MGDRMDALKDAIVHTEEQLRALHDRFEAKRPEDSDGMQNYIQETQRLLQNLSLIHIYYACRAPLAFRAAERFKRAGLI